MKTTLVISASCLLLAGCARPIVALDINDSWFECDRNRECTILKDPRCQLIPINRRYADSFAAWVRRNRSQQVSSTEKVRKIAPTLTFLDPNMRCRQIAAHLYERLLWLISHATKEAT